MIRRVAMLSAHTCPLATLGGKETGGMNVYVRDLSRELSRRGVAVDVFTRSQNPCELKVNHTLGPHARVIHIRAGPEEPYDKNELYGHLPEFVEGVRQFACDEEVVYDVIYSHYWISGWAARELREIWGGTPIVQMFHTLGHIKNSVARSRAEWETNLRLEVETEVMRFADLLVAATPMERAQMVWLYGADPAKIAVVPCGVDLDLFRPIAPDRARRILALSPEQKMVLYVGRIEPLKGIDTLLKAMARVVPRDPTWERDLAVVIIGGAPGAGIEQVNTELARLQQLRASLGIERLVTFLGAKDQDTLAYYYSAAQVVVVPSHYESFGMVALEAMACGAPVVASKVGGLAFNVRDGVTGFLVPDRDPEAMAERIHVLLADDGLRERLGSLASAWASNYSWRKVADQLLGLIHDVRVDLPPWTPCEE
jgi:D-inositol-3-phosphate glycosyltransferase